MLNKTVELNVDCQDSVGCTPLFYAVELGHLSCVKILLDSGASPNLQDKNLRTAAHHGACKGQLKCLMLLRKYGVSFDMENSIGELVLHEAVRSGSTELVDWLLHTYDNVNVYNRSGRSALHIAVKQVKMPISTTDSDVQTDSPAFEHVSIDATLDEDPHKTFRLENCKDQSNQTVATENKDEEVSCNLTKDDGNDMGLVEEERSLEAREAILEAEEKENFDERSKGELALSASSVSVEKPVSHEELVQNSEDLRNLIDRFYPKEQHQAINESLINEIYVSQCLSAEKQFSEENEGLSTSEADVDEFGLRRRTRKLRFKEPVIETLEFTRNDDIESHTSAELFNLKHLQIQYGNVQESTLVRQISDEFFKSIQKSKPASFKIRTFREWENFLYSK
ncbi:unnamed protein product [Soboliphyme baturini]|uniref:ANK_REP_REGION domain-containing protein n=1 Tax=Soboliphyme baturini TaxID=241478 RepID=A0A183IWD5_9BILA|nr:unnamed protein product [Soboliphyme baturini]